MTVTLTHKTIPEPSLDGFGKDSSYGAQCEVQIVGDVLRRYYLYITNNIIRACERSGKCDRVRQRFTRARQFGLLYT